MIRLLLLCLPFLCSCQSGYKTTATNTTTESLTQVPQGPQDITEFESFIDSFINNRLNKENIPGAAFAFVKDGKVFFMKGYGVANTETGKQVDPATTIFRIGSISKVFTADALLQLAGQNKLSLDTDVNIYLNSVQVPGSFSQPITARHIMTHTTGLDEIRPGTQAPDFARVEPLGRFLSSRLRRLYPPGEIIMYSTYGITLGGLLVEEISKQSFENYIQQQICMPLGMKNTNINVPDHLKENLAMGYDISGGVNVPEPWEWYHTTPASSINSTAEDMAKWLMAHLNKGRLQDGQLMPENMMQQMLSHQHGMPPAMYGMTYGFFEEYHEGLRFLYHGGNMAGYNSLVVLIPDKNAGFFFVSQHEGSSLRDDLKWEIMLRYYNDTPKFPIPVLKGDPRRANMFSGEYQYNVYCHTCPSHGSLMKFMIKANPDGSIQLNNKRWIETENKLVFRRDDGKSMVGFRADSSGKITHVSFGGFWTLEKVQ